MKHNYKRITALAGMTALLVSMPVSVYAGQTISAGSIASKRTAARIIIKTDNRRK